MEGRTERTRLMKLVFLILVIHGILLFMIASPFYLIDGYYDAVRDIDTGHWGLCILTIITTVFLWTGPKDDGNKRFLIFTIFVDILYAISVFTLGLSFSISEIRIIFSIIYLIPVAPSLLYIWFTDFVKEDITKGQYDFLINNEIMNYPTIEEGLDYVLDYIANPKWGFESGYKESFLEYLSKRDDELGQLARDRLSLNE